MLYMGKLARKSPDDPVRATVFQGEGIELLNCPGKRSRGRPRQQWRQSVYSHCLKAAGTVDTLARCFREERGSAALWRKRVSGYLGAAFSHARAPDRCEAP